MRNALLSSVSKKALTQMGPYSDLWKSWRWREIDSLVNPLVDAAMVEGAAAIMAEEEDIAEAAVVAAIVAVAAVATEEDRAAATEEEDRVVATVVEEAVVAVATEEDRVVEDIALKAEDIALDPLKAEVTVVEVAAAATVVVEEVVQKEIAVIRTMKIAVEEAVEEEIGGMTATRGQGGEAAVAQMAGK